MTTDVFLTRTAAFLPFSPVSNEDIEEVLGRIGGKVSRARRLILRSNGIQSRHYAIDRATGQLAMTNAQLTAAAIRALGDDIGPVDCLATGTSLPDQLMPNHAVMVHGELGWPRLEVVACAGICLAGAAALKHAWLSVRAGDARRAVATGSELASAVMRGINFEAELEHKLEALEARPEIAFEKDFLRWMLSDGAGAVLLEREPRGPLSLRVEWIELSSAAHELPVCMYAGADKNEQGGLDGWARTSPADWQRDSTFAVKQDVRLLNDNIVRATLAEPLAAIIERRGLKTDDIDWFLPHLSSHYFVEPVAASLVALGLPIPRERWFSNLATKGNTGSASPYIMLDELFRSGRIKPGQKLLMFVPESGRFSSGFIYLEAV
ncbi:3-oxoacyl-[acyl-carrier-protein] synthase-3 [Variovorax boronicumulans]|uniref:beta-ketoacyl-ACP synthase III n=1 Tax=Variovorax boronicumulans TaxID=436515 RepID=UPI000BB35DCE|nr:beta-ketoacyl-ACP synthase III [Variovorax boronicumulans]MDP9915890.1 3-oxoacyl-[acyl-carrier-protein] synthase-3 [Variovorax boronicumulans]PBI93798.1 3-oxoacyl-[acyl-carrier-protein] synthase 3 [Variovorax boronicumulans]